MKLSVLILIVAFAFVQVAIGASRVECNVVLECDPLTSCYSLKGGFPFSYGNKKEEEWRTGKKYSMFLARNVETVRCVLLDKYEF